MEEIVQDTVKKTTRIYLVKQALKSFHKNPKFYVTSFVWSVVSTAVGLYFFFNLQGQLHNEQKKTKVLNENIAKLEKQLEDLKNSRR